MRAFLASLEEQENEEGEKWQVGNRSVTVTVPDIDLSELGWPEAILLSHFAWGTPNPIAAETQPQPGPNEE
jgi:hypothetical protein